MSYSYRAIKSDDLHLAHFGIKGQKWGVRNYQNEDGTLTEEGKRRYGYYDREDGTKDVKRLQKDAAKDAKEYARAKAYYGEGAGNRRKQIRNLISERMKDSDYKKEFERQLGQQNMSVHQKAANRERKVQDAKNFAGKTARGVKNFILGAGTASLTAITLVSAARMLGVDKTIAAYGRRAVDSIVRKVPRAARTVRNGVARNGRINWGAFM